MILRLKAALLLLLLWHYVGAVLALGEMNATSSLSSALGPSGLRMNQESSSTANKILYFHDELGGIPSETSDGALRHNTMALSDGLTKYGSDATIIFRSDLTFYLYNGVRVYGLRNSVLQIDGHLKFKRDHNESFIPYDSRFVNPHNHVPSCFSCKDCDNITLTSAKEDGGRGLIHGGGPEWWGIPFIGYAQRLENRPYLILFNGTKGLNINRLVLQDAPFYNLQLTNVDHVEIHSISIVSRRTQQQTHSLVDLSAFNTDGIDIAGHHVHVHDVDIWTQDDCIAIKDNLWSEDQVSSNMTFERIYASGLGLTIGSISGTTVRDIVFRDSYLFKTFKGIYMKFRMPSNPLDSGNGLVENIYYENITMEAPIQWPIWIGPAQQTGGSSANLCHASPCSLCWPTLPFQTCDAVPNTQYRNITLKDIHIRNPQGSPGMILGGSDYGDGEASIVDLRFINVRVEVGAKGDDGVDLLSLFPSLKYPIDDNLAKRSVAAFYVIILVAALCLLTILTNSWRKRRRRRLDQSSSIGHNARAEHEGVMVEHEGLRRTRKWSKNGSKAALVAISMANILITIQLIHTFFMTPNIRSPQHYFVCRGVERGVATGATFPIPSCFADKTGRKAPSYSYIPILREQIVIALVLGSCWLAYCVMMRKLWPQADCFQRDRARGHRPIPESDTFQDDNDRGDESSSDGEELEDRNQMESQNSEESELTEQSDLSIHRSGAPPPPDVFSSFCNSVQTNFMEQPTDTSSP